MHRRSFIALVASLLPASWLRREEPKPKVNSDEFFTTRYDTKFWEALHVRANEELLKGYEPLQASVWRAV